MPWTTATTPSRGSKVSAWMAGPINALLGFMPGDRYGCGPGGEEACLSEYAKMSRWEDAQFDAGFDWDQLPLAFGYVAEGDKFPLWLAVLVLVLAFGFMSMRFLGQVFKPRVPEFPPEPPPVVASPPT